MQILHHGAVDGVTGSCHQLVMESGRSILIDCGLFQGAETDGRGGRAERLQIGFAIEGIQALVLTHVHLDHVGRIPYLLAAGFSGPIYCSQASAILLPLMLEDAVRIGFTRDKQQIERFIDLLRSRLIPVEYGAWKSIESGDEAALAIRLQPAGHILGSAYVECRVEGRTSETRQSTRVLFGGDLGAPHTPLLPAPKQPYGTDILVLESTYGDRLHQPRAGRTKQLKQVLQQALKDRGVVLIPAFSLGRTQELLYELESLIHSNRGRRLAGDLPWDELEVIVDSPLASRFTDAYRQLQPLWDKEAKGRLRRGRHPLSFEQLLTIDSHQDHQRTVAYLAKSARPCVVLAGSGMCNGGRVVNYLKALLGDARNDVVFVGYQAAGTPGRDIQRYGPKGSDSTDPSSTSSGSKEGGAKTADAQAGYVVLDRQRYPIRARVHSLSGYSAHADQSQLLNFVKRMRRRPREIRLVHGEHQAKQALKTRLQALLPDTQVIIP